MSHTPRNEILETGQNSKLHKLGKIFWRNTVNVTIVFTISKSTVAYEGSLIDEPRVVNVYIVKKAIIYLVFYFNIKFSTYKCTCVN